MVKQPCYFAKVCGCEFNKKHIGVTLFSLQFCVDEKMLKIMYEKGTTFDSRCWRLLREDSWAIPRSFDKSRKLMVLS